MARDENMPFPLGSTYYGGDSTIIDVNSDTNLEGQEYWIEDDDISTGTIGSAGARSGRKRRVRVVRNMNATTLNAREIAKVKIDGTAVAQFVGQVDGLCASVADRGFPVDEFLGTGGCLQYDMCYIVVDGLAQVKTDSGGDTNIPAGAVVVPGAATPGRIVQQDTTATGAALFQQINNAIGTLTLTVNANSTIVTVDVGGTHR